MKFQSPLAIATMVMLACCKPAGESASQADTLTMAEDTLAIADDGYAVQEELPRIAIAYYWGDAYPEIKPFAPFNEVYQEALSARRLRDSIYFSHSENGSTDFTPEDSAAFMPAVNKAHDVIMQYAERAKAGLRTQRTQMPRRTNSDLQPDDESHHNLRESSSKTLANAEFMFLGGAPFITQQPEVFKDPSGNWETHYVVQIPQNAEYFFDYVYAQYPTAMDLTYGPPLNVYEGTDVEIKGIGSITHAMKNRIPVWFLTTDGAIQATLIDVTMKLGYEYGCVPNSPAYTFACPKNIDPGSIFGVFSSNTKLPVEKGASTIFGQIWEYDIDGDGASDIATIQSTFSGASSDAMAVAIWYVKLGDDWVVGDYGTEPDCT